MNTPSLIDESTQEQRNLIKNTMPPIAAIGLLKSARDELLAANPEATSGLSVGSVGRGDLSVSFHGVQSFESACAILRRFGAANWDDLHHSIDQSTEISYVTVNIGHGFDLTVFFNGPADLKGEIASALKPEPPF